MNLVPLLIRRWKLITVLTLLVFAGSLFSFFHTKKGVNGAEGIMVYPTQNYPQGTSLIIDPSASQSTQLAVGTVEGWLSDPTVVQAIYAKANLSPVVNSIAALSKTFQFSTSSSVSLSVSANFSASSPANAQAIVSAMQSILNDKVQAFNIQKPSGLQMTLQYTNPLITDQTGNFPVGPIAGLLAGLVFAFVVAALTDRSLLKGEA